MTSAEWIASIGVGMLLCAFALQAVGLLPGGGRLYHGLNAVGAGLACWASWQIGFLPFVVLEGVWCLVAVAGWVKATEVQSVR